MMPRFTVVFILCCVCAFTTTAQQKPVKTKGKIQIIFLQLNDIYEISPLDHGKIGGIARVATVHNELKQINPLTYTVLAGDFLSPSALGTIMYDTAGKKKIAGLQMTDALNAAGINLVTFGNHEFDIKTAELNEAINRSSFDWVSSNVKINDSTEVKRYSKTKNGHSEPIPVTRILPFKDADGSQVKIGVFGLTIETRGDKRSEAYEDYFNAAANAIAKLRGSCDFIIAVTHLSIDLDKELARRFPEIKLILGGHEHINSYDKVGNTIIAKADANVKSVYVHVLNYDIRSKELNIKSRLLTINNAIEEDKRTEAVVDKWNAFADSLLKNQRFQPCEIIDSIAVPLDGREASIRITETNLGKLVGESMMEALTEKADCSIFNSGSIRIDDVLTGYITQYDIFRVLPFENKIVVRELQGNLIDSLLRTNSNRKNDGGYLQYAGIENRDSSFFINGRSLRNDTSYYKVAMNDYLGNGLQGGLSFIGKLQPPANLSPSLNISNNDIRQALITKLRKSSDDKQWPKNNRNVPCY